MTWRKGAARPACTVDRQAQEIGEEVHPDHDQFFRVEKGKGEVWIDGRRTRIKADDAIVVPAGARHNVINTGDKSLKLYTIYGPPDHREGIVRATKAEAGATEEHFDGTTTEPAAGSAAREVAAPEPA